MSKYEVPGGEDEQFEPGSNRTVLKNKLGITSPDAMAVAKTDALLDAQAGAVEWFEDTRRLSAEVVRRLHREWLGKIYDFAGEYRQVNMSKADILLCAAPYIADQMKQLETHLFAKFTPCKGIAFDDLCERIARIHAELLLIHPFREGNGRLARWIAGLMAMQAGKPTPKYYIERSDLDAKRQEYFAALRKGYFDQDVADLKLLFASWIRDAERNA